MAAAGGKPVGLLLLHLPRVPGSEGGVSRDAGGDHQRPDTKGGVGPHAHPLLSQEVTGDGDGGKKNRRRSYDEIKERMGGGEGGQKKGQRNPSV